MEAINFCFIVMVSQVYTYLQTHQAVCIKYLQLFNVSYTPQRRFKKIGSESMSDFYSQRDLKTEVLCELNYITLNCQGTASKSAGGRHGDGPYPPLTSLSTVKTGAEDGEHSRDAVSSLAPYSSRLGC